jgi:hypothetical protein
MNVVNAELQSILASIQTSLGRVDYAPLTTPSAWGSAYEIYVFGLILEEARRAGADPPRFLYGNSYPATQPYKFRRGGSRISAADDYTYVELTFSQVEEPKKPLEVHLGIYLCGPSCQRVQSDVCILEKEEADYFRVRSSRPRRNKSPYSWPDAKKVLLTAECKYYTGDLPSRVIHEVIGRDKELPASNHLIVVNTSSVSAGKRVLGSFNNDSRIWRSEAVPINPAGERRLRDRIRDVFDHYINDLTNVDN